MKNNKIFSGIIKAVCAMLILLVWQENSYSQTTWTGAVDDKWQDSGNWDAGLPAATVSAFINNNDAVVLDSGVASTQSLIVSGNSTLTVSNGVILSASRSSVGGGPLSTNSFLTINGAGSIVTISFTSSALLIGKGTTANDTTGTVTVENGGELRLLNGLTGYVSLGGDNAINPTTGVSTGKLILNGTAGSRGVMQFRQTRTDNDFGIIEFDGGILRAAGNESDFFQVDALGTLTVTLNSGGGFIDTNGFDIGIDQSITGTGALTKQGLGTLTLSASSSYLGGTTLSQGTLVVGNNNALGLGTLTIENGTTLSQTTGGMTLTNNIVLNGNFTRTAAIGDILTLSGNIELGSATRTITNNDWTLALNGSISGTAGLTLNAGNIVSMGGSLSNTYTGLTTVNGGNGLSLSKNSGATAIAGNLWINSGSRVSQSGDDQIADTSTVTVNGNYQLDGASEAFQTLMGSGSVEAFQFPENETFAVGSGNFSGTIEDTGPADTTLRKFGIGTLTLSGTNTYRGGTQLDGGILSISADNNLGNSSGGLIFNGATLQNTAAFSTARVTTLNAAGGTFLTGANLTHSGIISGAGSLTKTGASTLTLSGSNTYLGGTQINGGILSVSADNNLGNSTGGLTFDDGTLQNTAAFSTARVTTLNAGGGTFQTDADLTHSGIISGAGSLTKTGASTLTLSGSNTYLGGTQINGGILSVSADNNLGNSSGGLTFDGGTLQNPAAFSTARATTLNAAGGTFQTDADLTHSGIISGAGSLTKTGASTLTLSGANTYSGGTTLSAGTLVIGNNSALGTGTLTIEDNTTLSRTSGNKTLANNVVINGDFTSDGGGTSSDITVNGTTDLGAGTRSITTVNAGNFNFDGVVFGTGGITYNGSSGNLRFRGAADNTYTGLTTVQSGGLSLLKSAGVNAIAGDILINGGQINIFRDEQIADTSTVTLNGGSLVLWSTSETIGVLMGSGLVSGLQTSGNKTFAVGSGNFSGTIEDTGFDDTTLRKFGIGTLTLSGANTYRGGTQLDGGILSISADNNLGDSSGGLIFNGGTLQNTAAFSTARVTTLNAGGGTFQTDADLTHSGIISGSGSLTKTGASTLTLSGSNTYLGGTQLIDGILSVSADNNLGNSTGGLNFDGGTLQNTAAFSMARATTLNAAGGTFQTGADLTHSGIISGAGSLAKNGASTLTLSGSNTYLGGTQLNAGILSVSADNNLGDFSGGLTFNGGTLQNAATFSTARATTLNAGGGIFLTGADLTHSGVISGAGSLTKTGASSLLLSGSNTYSGGTIINSGTLRTTSLTALGSGPVIHNAGILDPVGTLNTGDFTWNGGTIATDIGTTTDFIDAAGSLILGAPGEFDFTKVAGFSNNTFYKIFNADNLGVFDPTTDFFGNALLGLAPIFSITGNDLFVNFLGTPFFTGAILQNSAPVGIPTFSDFIVNGAVTTGSPTENNIINGLIFNPSSSLRVFNTLTVTSGRFTVNAGTGTVNGGRIIVPGDFNKDGAGKLVLNDTVSVAGAARVKAGSLYVNGTFTTGGGLTVFQNALLGGSGIINGNVVNNGTVNPGNSPGTLTINGNYTQSSSGTLQVEIASPSVFDRLVVRDNAALAGTLQAINFAGNQLDYGQQLEFLQAGSISGDFDRILMPDPDRFRGRFLAEGGTGTLLVAPTSYTLVAATANQRSVARALDSYISERGNDQETISIALDMQSEGQYAAAFDAITPAFYENLTDIIVEQAVAHNQMLVQRMSAIRLGSRGFSAIGIEASPLRYDRSGKDVMGGKESGPVSAAHVPRWSTWVQASGIFAKLSNTSQMPSLNFQTGGVLIGADHTFGESVDANSTSQDPKLTVGGYIGYDYTWIDNAGDSNSRISSALIGAYAIYENGGFYAETILGGGQNDYRMRRSITFSTVDRTARSSPDGGQFNAYQDLGYDWRAGGFTIGVLAGSQYTYAGISSFSENGAESLDLRLDRQEVNSIRTNLGGRIAYAWDLGPNLIVIPELRVFWQHEFLQNSREIGATLDGGKGSSFGYETEALGQDGIQAGAGVSARFSRDWSAYLYYNTNFARQDYLSHSVSTGLEWRF